MRIRIPLFSFMHMLTHPVCVCVRARIAPPGDWYKNCKSTQCSGCSECSALTTSQPACKSAADADLPYEECFPTCYKQICHMCLCKSCSTCGGRPPAALGHGDACETSYSVALDVDGKLELTIDGWQAGEEITIKPPPFV